MLAAERWRPRRLARRRLAAGLTKPSSFACNGTSSQASHSAAGRCRASRRDASVPSCDVVRGGKTRSGRAARVPRQSLSPHPRLRQLLNLLEDALLFEAANVVDVQAAVEVIDFVAESAGHQSLTAELALLSVAIGEANL